MGCAGGTRRCSAPARRPVCPEHPGGLPLGPQSCRANRAAGRQGAWGCSCLPAHLSRVLVAPGQSLTPLSNTKSIVRGSRLSPVLPWQLYRHR